MSSVTWQENFNGGKPADLTVYSGSSAVTTNGEFLSLSPDCWYFSGPRFWANGNFSLDYDIRFDSSETARDIANMAFWVNSPGTGANGFIFRLQTQAGDGGLFLMNNGQHGQIGNSFPALGVGVQYHARITVTGTVCVATVTVSATGQVFSQTQLDLAPYIDSLHLKTGTIGHASDSVNAAPGHYIDNIVMTNGNPGASWQFILTDLAGKVIGEVTNASARAVNLPLDGMPTAGFAIPALHPLTPYLTSPTWDGLLKVYRTSYNGTRKLVFHGPVVSTNEVGDSSGPPTLTVTASSVMWRLGYRLLGNTAAGWTMGNATTTYDLATQIVPQMLSDSNAAGYTGIDMGTTATTEQGAAGTYWLQPTLQAIATLSAGLNSFDFEVAPTEATNVGQAWPRIGLLNAVPLIGTSKPNAIFEFGTGQANVISYQNQIDRTNLMTRGYCVDPSATDHSNTVIQEDTAQEALRGVFEGVVDNGSVQSNVLRQSLVQLNISVRKQARQLVTLQPRANVTPEPLVDYIVGDYVRVRLVPQGLVRVDGLLRVWGISFAIDQNGNETATLATQQQSTGF